MSTSTVESLRDELERAKQRTKAVMRQHPRGSKPVQDALDDEARIKRLMVDEERCCQVRADIAVEDADEARRLHAEQEAALCQAALVEAHKIALRMDRRQIEEAADASELVIVQKKVFRHGGANRFKLRAALEYANSRYLFCLAERLKPAEFHGAEPIGHLAWSEQLGRREKDQSFAGPFRKHAGIEPPNEPDEIFSDPPAA